MLHSLVCLDFDATVEHWQSELHFNKRGHAGGFKSMKSRWLCAFEQEKREQERREREEAARRLTEQVPVLRLSCRHKGGQKRKLHVSLAAGDCGTAATCRSRLHRANRQPAAACSQAQRPGKLPG